MKRLALNALQQAVYSLLTDETIDWSPRIPVFNDIPDQTLAPYIITGVSTKIIKDGSKDLDTATYEMPLFIYSKQNGTKELNEIADDVTGIISSYLLARGLKDTDFKLLAAEITEFASQPESTAGYEGWLILTAKIQYLKA